MKDKGTSRRGRPPSTSAARIARTALELFTRDGYDATTLDDVAVAAGVSRSTVLRYLPGKGAIVWADEEAAGAALLADLAGRVPGPRWRTQVASVLIGAIRFPPDELRMRLRLIEQVPSLRRHLDATAAPT
ncbi:MAG TPA: helix-turn-helix domain-containing protein, partial [Actinotalea sp.]|nr:helix-turn-helix domain-containing protein [Actinotalea sp.]